MGKSERERCSVTKRAGERLRAKIDARVRNTTRKRTREDKRAVCYIHVDCSLVQWVATGCTHAGMPCIARKCACYLRIAIRHDTYIRVDIYIYIHIPIYICIYRYTYIYVYIDIYRYIYEYIYVYVYINVYIYTYVYTLYLHVFIYIYTYVCI